MADIVRLNGDQLVVGAAIEDHFAIAFAPARPVLDALAELRKVRNYLAEFDQRNPQLLRNGAFYDMTPSERLAFLPEVTALEQAKALFHEAEHVPAPEEWFHLAFGTMLAAAPNSGKVPVDYTFGLVDSILNDEELHRGYEEMGFSFAVVVLAIGERYQDDRTS